MPFIVSFILKFFCPEFIKKVLDYCIKKNPLKTFFLGIVGIAVCYYFFEKPKDYSEFSEKERYDIRKSMLHILSTCESDGSGITYAQVYSKDRANLHDIRYIDVFGYSVLFPESSHIRQLGNVDMFLNPDPIDGVAHKQITQKFINELHRSIEIDVSKASEIVNSNYVKSIKEKLWVGMNATRVKNELQPYKLTQIQIYPILDKKSNIIYLLTMTFTNNNLCNSSGFNTMFDELGIQIENAIND
jgi:hypothetical protein